MISEFFLGPEWYNQKRKGYKWKLPAKSSLHWRKSWNNSNYESPTNLSKLEGNCKAPQKQSHLVPALTTGFLSKCGNMSPDPDASFEVKSLPIMGWKYTIHLAAALHHVGFGHLNTNQTTCNINLADKI